MIFILLFYAIPDIIYVCREKERGGGGGGLLVARYLWVPLGHSLVEQGRMVSRLCWL